MLTFADVLGGQLKSYCAQAFDSKRGDRLLDMLKQVAIEESRERPRARKDSGEAQDDDPAERLRVTIGETGRRLRQDRESFPHLFPPADRCLLIVARPGHRKELVGVEKLPAARPSLPLAPEPQSC